MDENQSPKYKLNKLDLRKIGIGAAVAAGGALVTYGAELVAQIDFGDLTPLVVMAASILVNIARKWLVGANS